MASGREWPAVFGEATLVVLVVVVSLIIDPRSRNLLDLKDFTLGIGVAVGLALVLLSSLAKGSLSWASVRLNALVGAYLGWAAASTAYSHYRFATVSELARLASHVGLFWLVILSVREMRQVRRIIWAAAIAAIPVCIYAFVQAAGRDPIRWGTTTTRAFSFLGNATYLAGYLVLLIPLIVALAWPRREAAASSAQPARRMAGGAWVVSIFLFAVIGLMLFCLYLTISFSPSIGLVLGGGLATLLVLIRGGRRAARAVVPGMAVALVVLLGCGYLGYRRLPPSQKQRVHQVMSFQDPYGEERELLQRVGLDIFRRQPIIGGAYGTYSVVALQRLAPSWYGELGKGTNSMLVPNYAHNEFIEVLAEMGLVGALLFVALIVTAYAAAVRVSLRDPEAQWRRLGLALIAGLIAFVFQNLFGVTFRQTGTVTFFWLSLGLLAVAQSRLSMTAGDHAGPAVRECRLRPLSGPALGAAGIALAGVIVLLVLVGIRPVRSNLLVKQAEREAKRGQFQTAAALADQALALNPYSTLGYYISAFAWGSQGNYKRALEANQRALALLPGNASVYYNQGVTYKELGRLKEARDSFQRAIELMPTAMRHHAAMAEVLLQMGRYDEAIPYAEEAIRLEPGNPNAHLLLADIYSRRGDLEATAAQVTAAWQVAPRDPLIFRQLARIQFRLGKYKEVEEVCDRWTELDPSSSEAYLLLASAAYNLKQYQTAIPAFEKAIGLNPGDLPARLRLVYTRIRLNDFLGAEQDLGWIVSHYPETPEGKKAATLVQKLRTLRARQAPEGVAGQARAPALQGTPAR